MYETRNMFTKHFKSNEKCTNYDYKKIGKNASLESLLLPAKQKKSTMKYLNFVNIYFHFMIRKTLYM